MKLPVCLWTIPRCSGQVVPAPLLPGCRGSIGMFLRPGGVGATTAGIYFSRHSSRSNVIAIHSATSRRRLSPPRAASLNCLWRYAAKSVGRVRPPPEDRSVAHLGKRFDGHRSRGISRGRASGCEQSREIPCRDEHYPHLW
jgi:hypothetical protein